MWPRVLLISRAPTFYLLRQFWLPLFGCHYKSRGSMTIVSSGERTEEIGCTEWRGGKGAGALLAGRIVDHLTWEIHRQGSAPSFF